MKGIGNVRPPLPKYTVVWEVDEVLKILKNLYPNNELSPKMLTWKTATILGLVAIPRGCELSYLDTTLMGAGKNIFIFSFNCTLKHSKPGKRAQDLKIHEWADDPSICPVKTLQDYLNMTKPWRETNNETKVFLSHINPHEHVKKCTIAGWVKNIMKLAGIDTQRFTAHSMRAASSSKAHSQGLALQDILSRGNWSQNSTWQKFYHKPINVPSLEYQNSILDLKKL